MTPSIVPPGDPALPAREAMAREARDIDILARTIWGEARGESVRGMEAVAAVILNRARISDAKGGFWWGRGIAEICQKPFQFSCWNPNDPNRNKLLSVGADDRHFAIALRIATRAVRGALGDPTGGAEHYHARAILPDWARGRERSAAIGGHIFYRLTGRQEVTP